MYKPVFWKGRWPLGQAVVQQARLAARFSLRQPAKPAIDHPSRDRNLYAAVLALAQATNQSLAKMVDATGISEDTHPGLDRRMVVTRRDPSGVANTPWSTATIESPLPSCAAGELCPPPPAGASPEKLPPHGQDGVPLLRRQRDYHAHPCRRSTRHLWDQGHPTHDPEGSSTPDEILGNPTDLPIAKHAVDTGGKTVALFAAFDLMGLLPVLTSHQIHLPSRRLLYRLGLARNLDCFPHAGPLLRRRLNEDLVLGQWEELFRPVCQAELRHPQQ